VKTPGKHTIKQVSELLNVPATKLIKTLIYEFTARPAPIGTGEPAKSAGETQEPVKPSHVAVLIRGDHELNEAKLARVTGAGAIKLAGAAVIERLSGAPVGFTGPVKLEGAQLLADHAVMSIVNGVTGANQADAHLINVNPVRDFRPEQVADLRFILGSDPCPKCRGKLEEITAVEIGHVFKLGTKYSQALGAMVQDAQGKLQPMIMGCYGIGVNRILACAIEQSHDGQGIIWPRGLAPFEILISLLDPGEPELAAAAEALYARLVSEGREVLLDDREQSPGAKLKDADLIGIPVQVVVGKVWQREKRFELCLRATKERLQSDEKSVSEAVSKLLDKAP